MYLFFFLAEDFVSIQLDESGWAWLVYRDRLIIWKMNQSSVAKVNQQLATISNVDFCADCIAL